MGGHSAEDAILDLLQQRFVQEQIIKPLKKVKLNQFVRFCVNKVKQQMQWKPPTLRPPW